MDAYRKMRFLVSDKGISQIVSILIIFSIEPLGNVTANTRLIPVNEITCERASFCDVV